MDCLFLTRVSLFRDGDTLLHSLGYLKQLKKTSLDEFFSRLGWFKTRQRFYVNELDTL